MAFRVRHGSGPYLLVSIKPGDSAADIKEAVAATVGLPVGTFVAEKGGVKSPFRGDLLGDWDIVLLPAERTPPKAVAAAGAGAGAGAGANADDDAGEEVRNSLACSLHGRPTLTNPNKLFFPPVLRSRSLGAGIGGLLPELLFRLAYSSWRRRSKWPP